MYTFTLLLLFPVIYRSGQYYQRLFVRDAVSGGMSSYGCEPD